MSSVLLSLIVFAQFTYSTFDAKLIFDRCCNPIELIKTFQCRVQYNSYKGKDTPVSSCDGKFFLRNNTYRILERNVISIGAAKNAVDYDIFCDGKTVRQLSKTGVAYNGGISAVNKPVAAKCNAYDLMLLNIITPKYSAYRSARDLFSVLEVKSVVEKTTSGGSVVEIQGTCEIDEMDLAYVFEFDASVNYLLRSMQINCRLGGVNIRHKFSIGEFIEAQNGIFVPATIRRECYLDGVLEWHAQTSISDVKVNSNLPAIAFDFKFPHGQEVFNSINSTKYHVDSQGNRITSEVAMQSGGLLVGGTQPPANSFAAKPGASSTTESISAWHYAPYLFGLLFAISFGFWLRFRFLQFKLGP